MYIYYQQLHTLNVHLKIIIFFYKFIENSITITLTNVILVSIFKYNNYSNLNTMKYDATIVFRLSSTEKEEIINEAIKQKKTVANYIREQLKKDEK